VISAAGNTLTANVFNVGATGIGPITVVVGDGTALPDQLINQLGITSTSSQIKMLLNGAGGSSAAVYNLFPGSPNTISTSFGAPAPASGAISFDTSSLSGDGMAYRLAFKVGSRFYEFEARIDFSGTPDAAQRARHLASQISTSFGPEGVTTGVSVSNVRISMAGASYGGIVLAGV